MEVNRLAADKYLQVPQMALPDRQMIPQLQVLVLESQDPKRAEKRQYLVLLPIH